MARRHDAACQGKKVFELFSRAKKAASLGSFRHDQKLHAYLCPFCHKFHVGERRPGARRPRLDPINDEELT